MIGFKWNVGQLPFYYRPLSSPSNGYALPNFMQFNLEVSEKNRTSHAGDAAGNS